MTHTPSLLMLGLTLAAVVGPASRAATSEASAVAWPRVASRIATDPAVEARIDALLARMSLEDKAAQMVQAEIKHVTPADLRKYRLGSILNGGGSWPGDDKHASVADWLRMADAYYDASMDQAGSRVAIPVLWGTDAVHGHNNVLGATLFPHNIGLGAARNPALVERIAEATAREVAATGIAWVFAPTLAVVRDDRWGRTYEGYSEDPALVREYAGRAVAGLQGAAGRGAFGPGRVIATAKHFIGDGGTQSGVDQGDTLASEAELLAVHAQGYLSALEAGAQTVMATFNSWLGRKVHGHRYLLNDVLKQRMGFDGFVVSDWNGVGQVPGCTNASCAQAINAGIDLVMAPQDWKAQLGNIVEQLRSGAVPEARVDDAVRRILRVKLRAGLFEAGRPSGWPAAANPSVVGSAAHRALARDAVRQSLVLLKNQGGLLPLGRGVTVLVAGDGADNVAKQAGGWTLTWQGTGNVAADFPGATSIHGGIREAVSAGGGSAVLSVDGRYEQKPDVAIVVFGEEPYAEGQGDRAHLDYFRDRPADLALLRKLKADGIPLVSVFLTGRPLWVNAALNLSDAFVVAWLPGSEGAGVADVLFRDADGAIGHDFRGTLSYSWPRGPMQTLLNVGDPGYAPLFPFGYGLSYRDVPAPWTPLPETSSPGAAGAAGDRLAIYERRPVPPWRLFVGDRLGWQVPLPGGDGESGAGAISVRSTDKDLQGDALRMTWTSRGDAQVYLQGPPQDLRPWLERDAALVVHMRLESRPTRPVKVRMGCGYPCGADGDLTQVMREAPLDTWFALSIDLACFAEGGANMSQIDTAFQLLTSGSLTLSTAAIAVVPGRASNATIRCGR